MVGMGGMIHEFSSPPGAAERERERGRGGREGGREAERER